MRRKKDNRKEGWREGEKEGKKGTTKHYPAFCAQTRETGDSRMAQPLRVVPPHIPILCYPYTYPTNACTICVIHLYKLVHENHSYKEPQIKFQLPRKGWPLPNYKSLDPATARLGTVSQLWLMIMHTPASFHVQNYSPELLFMQQSLNPHTYIHTSNYKHDLYT